MAMAGALSGAARGGAQATGQTRLLPDRNALARLHQHARIHTHTRAHLHALAARDAARHVAPHKRGRQPGRRAREAVDDLHRAQRHGRGGERLVKGGIDARRRAK